MPLELATCTDGAVPEIENLAMGLATNSEADHKIWGETPYIGAANAAFEAMALYGEVMPQTFDACARGNGMIMHWKKDAGSVFTAVTCEWVAGLVRNDMQVIAVTRNVLNRFGAG